MKEQDKVLELKRKIDENGYFVEDVLTNDIAQNIIDTPVPDGFYKPRWDGIEWIEGADEEYIESLLQKNKPLEPTQEDYLLDLDYRLSKIELGL